MTRHTASNPVTLHSYATNKEMPESTYTATAPGLQSQMTSSYFEQNGQSQPSNETSEVDFLTCGNCQREYLLSEIVQFMKHKKLDCRDINSYSGRAADLYQRLMCQIKNCQQKFSTAWGLLQHVQNSHALNIFLALSLYSQGIEHIQVHPPQEPATPAIDVNSLCMLGLGDTFQDAQFNKITATTPEPTADKSRQRVERSPVPVVSSHQTVETQTEKDGDDVDDNGCIPDLCSPEICAISECCDAQNCCITIMPGTHERPKKCCMSVVPKKRKQHMEQHISTKSGMMTRSRRRRASRSDDVRRQDTIYIDFGSPIGNSPQENDVTFTQTQGSQQNRYVQVEGTNMYVRNHQDMMVSVDPQDSNSHFNAQEFTLPESFQSLLMQDLPTTMADAGDMGPKSDDNDDAKKKRYPTSRPFKCDSCNMSFNQRIHLKKHLSKHTGIKPFKCGQCNYSTVERSHLKVHIRIHTGEKPYKCAFCEYATAQNSTLKIHLKRHHNGMTSMAPDHGMTSMAPDHGMTSMACTVCGKNFTQLNQLSKHRQLQHRPLSRQKEQGHQEHQEQEQGQECLDQEHNVRDDPLEPGGDPDPVTF